MPGTGRSNSPDVGQAAGGRRPEERRPGSEQRRPGPEERRPAPKQRRPAAMCLGAGHVVVHGNSAFVAAFGQQAIGVPAREGLVSLPGTAFAALDAAFARRRPVARWIRWSGADWRLTIALRTDVETGDVYGVSFHLRARDDTPEPG